MLRPFSHVPPANLQSNITTFAILNRQTQKAFMPNASFAINNLFEYVGTWRAMSSHKSAHALSRTSRL
jgi:hypothetical protein